MSTNRFREAAEFAAVRDWFVFPLSPGSKRPAIRAWPQQATTDTDRIQHWWSVNPHYNVGIATGPSRLHVVDLDTHNDLDGPGVLYQLATAARARESLLTFTVATPSGTGRHLYYRAPQGLRLPNSAARIAPGVDTRGHGGYVVAAGSRTRVGDYRLLTAGPVAELPTWLLELLTPPPPQATANSGAAPQYLGAYLQAILTAESHKVTTAAPGTRNTTLFRAAFTLGRLVAAGELDHYVAKSVLIAAAEVHVGHRDFTRREVERTISSGFAIGARRPRRLNSSR